MLYLLLAVVAFALGGLIAPRLGFCPLAKRREKRLAETMRQAETLASALETSQMSLELATRGANIGLWHWDVTTGYFELTSEWLTNLRRETLDLGADVESFRALLNPEDRVLWTEADAVSLAAGEPYDRQFRIRRGDGSYAWTQAMGRANALRADGAPESLSGVLIDITSRKGGELHDAGMARIIEESLNEVYVFDAETCRFVVVNRGARENLGWSLDELRAMTPWDLKPEYDEASFRRFVEPLATGASPRLEFQTVHRRRDGSTYPVMVNLQLAKLVDRAVYAAIIVDLTQRQELESQLRHAQKLESLGQLAAGVAHEINTPLQFIGANLTYLSDAGQLLHEVLAACERTLGLGAGARCWPAALSDLEGRVDLKRYMEARRETPQAVADSLDGAERALRIVRAMKELAHPGDVASAPADLNHTATSVATLTKNRWKEVADLRLELDPSLPAVECESNSIAQVFINLVVNAADALLDRQVAEPDHEGRIVVRSRAEGDAVLFEVEDNGCGMTPEVAARAFDPFFTTKDVGRGTGQGLSLCHAIVVRNHGGSIQVVSKPGEGSTFRLRLPTQPTGRPPEGTLAASTAKSPEHQLARVAP